ECYPTHTFLHTIGALRCCATGGCWKSRTKAIGDGDEKDSPEQLCVDVVGDLPHCMDLITTSDVVRAVEKYVGVGISTADVQVRMAPQQIIFITVTDNYFAIGTIATCNSIRRFHPDAAIAVVNCERDDKGLTEPQRRVLEQIGCTIIDG